MLNPRCSAKDYTIPITDQTGKQAVAQISHANQIDRQILHCTEASKDREDLELSLGVAESLLAHINESIREQESYERLKTISQDLWVGNGYGPPTHPALVELIGL